MPRWKVVTQSNLHDPVFVKKYHLEPFPSCLFPNVTSKNWHFVSTEAFSEFGWHISVQRHLLNALSAHSITQASTSSVRVVLT